MCTHFFLSSHIHSLSIEIRQRNTRYGYFSVEFRLKGGGGVFGYVRIAFFLRCLPSDILFMYTVVNTYIVRMMVPLSPTLWYRITLLM